MPTKTTATDESPRNTFSVFTSDVADDLGRLIRLLHVLHLLLCEGDIEAPCEQASVSNGQ